MTKRSLFWLAVLIALAVCGTVALRAQTPAANSILRPPKGAKVALVVFADLQCPDCARAAPLIAQAERTYKIPVVRYDFPLPMHSWSFDAAVMAQYFDSKGGRTGVDFREYIFRNQPQITPDNLRTYAEKFAQERNLGGLPFLIDPQGKLAAEVNKEKAIGNQVGIQHTPTINVVNNSRSGQPFVEVADRSQLYQLIDQMRQDSQ
jgi:protein-disulfide isomerase